MREKQTNPRRLPVQLNISVPWAFREYLAAEAEKDRVSLNKLCFDTLRREYGKAFDRSEAEFERAEKAARTALQR